MHIPSRVTKDQQHAAPEVAAYDAILRYADDSFFTVNRGIECFLDIDVEPALHLLILRRDRFHNFIAESDLVKRGHSLLTVEQE